MFDRRENVRRRRQGRNPQSRNIAGLRQGLWPHLRWTWSRTKRLQLEVRLRWLASVSHIRVWTSESTGPIVSSTELFLTTPFPLPGPSFHQSTISNPPKRHLARKPKIMNYSNYPVASWKYRLLVSLCAHQKINNNTPQRVNIPSPNLRVPLNTWSKSVPSC